MPSSHPTLSCARRRPRIVTATDRGDHARAGVIMDQQLREWRQKTRGSRGQGCWNCAASTRSGQVARQHARVPGRPGFHVDRARAARDAIDRRSAVATAGSDQLRASAIIRMEPARNTAIRYSETPALGGLRPPTLPQQSPESSRRAPAERPYHSFRPLLRNFRYFPSTVNANRTLPGAPLINALPELT